MKNRFIVLLLFVVFLSVCLPKLEMDHVWQQTVFAQVPTSVPIQFGGGSPGCTNLIAAVAGQRVFVNNGILSIPAFGTGLSVQFVASTDTGSNVACSTAATKTNVSGFYVGSQVGTTATNPTIYNFNGSPALVTPLGSGLSATVSAATGAQAVSGHLTFIQQ